MPPLRNPDDRRRFRAGSEYLKRRPRLNRYLLSVIIESHVYNKREGKNQPGQVTAKVFNPKMTSDIAAIAAIFVWGGLDWSLTTRSGDSSVLMVGYAHVGMWGRGMLTLAALLIWIAFFVYCRVQFRNSL
jgi:hypothetical protein